MLGLLPGLEDESEHTDRYIEMHKNKGFFKGGKGEGGT